MFGSGRDLVNSGYYDRWKTSPPEPKEKDRVGYCACSCDEPIYVDEPIYRLEDGRMVREDCWDAFVEMELGATYTTADLEEPKYVDRDD